MSIVINGSGTISGISVGGLPDSIVDAGTLATNSVDSAELIDGAVDNSHLANDAVAIAELAATGTPSSTTFLRGDNSWQTAGSTSATDLTSGTLPTARLPVLDHTKLPVGSILQVVTAAEDDGFSTTSTSYLDVMSLAITPLDASSKLLIRCQLGEPDIATGRGQGICWVGNNGTEVFRLCTEFGRGESYGAESHTQNIIAESDFITAGNTNARTYGMAIKNNVSGQFRIGNGADHKITIFEIKA